MSFELTACRNIVSMFYHLSQLHCPQFNDKDFFLRPIPRTYYVRPQMVRLGFILHE